MTNSRKQKYDVYLNLPSMGVINAAQAVCVETDGRLNQFGFRYTPQYLDIASAIPFDPLQLPLSNKEFQFRCVGGIPGVLDDYLPDAWGRKVLSYLSFYRDKKKISHHSCIDSLALMGGSRIGAIQFVSEGNNPLYEFGCEFSQLQKAESAAQHVDENNIENADFDELSLLYLANAGTGIGGARPKALIQKNGKAYLAKFNRLQHDEYNNARVELACLLMAKEAGINVFGGVIERGINGREVLLLERFDTCANHRHHLITINALLKSTVTQSDNNGVFRYDDIANIIRKYSISVEYDLQQLLRIMLFNRGINNTDDHERNFSLINRGEGYQLAPAYDLVPSLARGAYHIAGYQHSPSPPYAKEAHALGKIFGLPKTQVKLIADEVIEAFKSWEKHAEITNVCEGDQVKLRSIIRA
ncbi:MAG: type II toxin-antitoxin system HipA family toxin [Agarilytica sp.]